MITLEQFKELDKKIKEVISIMGSCKNRYGGKQYVYEGLGIFHMEGHSTMRLVVLKSRLLENFGDKYKIHLTALAENDMNGLTVNFEFTLLNALDGQHLQ